MFTFTSISGIAMTTAIAPRERTTSPLLEVAFSSAPKVDRGAGVIRAVKILGKQSRNGRMYTDEALAQAAGLYEGVCVHIDHPEAHTLGGDRKFADGFGYLQGVRRQDDGVYGDLVFLKSHTLAEQICESAEKMPRQFGLSHHAEGYVTTQDDKTIVEGIARVFSVDIVRNPATNRGLFESLDNNTQQLRATAPNNVVSSNDHGESSESQIARLQEQIRRLEAERDVRHLLESAGIAPDAAKIKALAALGTPAEQAALMATWPRNPRTQPRSSGPLRESTRVTALPIDGKSFARAIR